MTSQTTLPKDGAVLWRSLTLGAIAYFVAVAGPLWVTARIDRNFGLWPATAVGIAVLLQVHARQRAVAVLVLTITNAVAILTFGQVAWQTLLGLLAAHLVSEVGTVWIVERAVKSPFDVERLSHLAAFTILASLVTLPLAALVGSFDLVGVITWPTLNNVLSWWAPEAALTLLLVPALLRSFWRTKDHAEQTDARGWERLAIIAIFVVSLASLFSPYDIRLARWTVAITMSPLLIWAALRTGVGLTAWLVTAIAVTSVIATVSGVRPFILFSPQPILQLIAAISYALVVGLSAIFLAATQAQRRRADRAEARAFQTMSRSAERFTAFFRTTRDPITLVDEQGTVVAISPAAVALLLERTGDAGAPKQGERIGASVARMPSALRTPLDEGWSRALAGEASTRRLETAPGYEIGVTWHPLRDERGNTIGASASMIDLSKVQAEAVEMERARRLETVGRLAGGIAHDFNNILTVVLANLDVLEESLEATDPRRVDTNEVRAAALRAVTLTQQLLTYARRRVVSPQLVDLSAHVTGLDSMLRRLIGADVQLVLQAPVKGPVVSIDPAQLDQIVMNLAANARDAMPQGGQLQLRVGGVDLDAPNAARLRIPAGRYAELAVTDSGVGIPPDVLVHILEPFFTTKDVGEGNGLGLATVDSIARQGGGAVVVESTVGEGSVFRLYFPQLAVEADAPAPDRPAVKSASKGNGRVILVCEDEAPIRTVLVRLLGAQGYVVHAAGSVPEALTIAETHPIDALVTDVVLPGVSGVVLADTLGQQQPGLAVLLISGYAEELLAERGNDASRYRFLAKPFKTSNLLDAIDTALREAPRAPVTGGGSP